MEGEYLIIENRQPIMFDEYFWGNGGIVIYHIDDNAVYVETGAPIWGNHQRGGPFQDDWPGNFRHFPVAVLQADGLYELEQALSDGDEGDLWGPGAVLGPGNGELVHTEAGTYPNTDGYSNNEIRVTNIVIDGFTEVEPGVWMFRVTGLAPADANAPSSPINETDSTSEPSSAATGSPSAAPSGLPSIAPSGTPSVSSAPSTSQMPSSVPTISLAPSMRPSVMPSSEPTVSFAPSISIAPSAVPTISLEPSLSSAPSASALPSTVPSVGPTGIPSLEPTSEPTNMTSSFPSLSPTDSSAPTETPTKAPTAEPILISPDPDGLAGAPSNSGGPTVAPVAAYTILMLVLSAIIMHRL